LLPLAGSVSSKIEHSTPLKGIIMLRSQWKFTFTAVRLAEGAAVKLKYHEDRITFWKKQKTDLVAEIRKDGLEVSEGTALGYSHPKSRDYERGAKVMVRNDLQEKLDECMEKLAHHVGKHRDYDGWSQVLKGNPEDRLEVDMDDWLFYFGKN
jgi:hypothetical protein